MIKSEFIGKIIRETEYKKFCGSRQKELLGENQHIEGKAPRIIARPSFWVLIILFAIGIIFHYPQQILHIDSPSLLSPVGLTRHAVERIFFLLPIGYAGFVFGKRGGIISLIAASIIMLPRILFISEYQSDAWLETAGVIVIGGLMNLWFEGYRREKEHRQQMLSKLEEAHQQLQSQVSIIKSNAERLATLNEISSLVSRSLELEDVLNVAADKIKEVMNLDIVLIFLLNEENKELELKAYRGISDDFAAALKGLKVGEGFCGKAAQTGELQLIEDNAQDSIFAEETVKKEGIRGGLVVPLKAEGKVTGILCVAMHGSRQFLDEEIELLITIGNQIGVAIENARLYEREHLAAQQALASESRYREIFENANDAIWIHDLDGNILAVNKAAEKLTGYGSAELLKMNVRSFLTEESLNLAGEIRRALFLGETVKQPYEQRLIRRDGTEGILTITSNMITENGRPKGFQHIARDVTMEKEMQEKLSAAYQELSESHQKLQESQEQLIQAEKLTSLGQLAASIAHEVNNPLSGILVYTQLLAKKLNADTISKENALNYLSKMEAELTRSTRLIRNLLDFARQSTPTLREVNLNDVINRSFDLAAHSAELQHVQVIKELDPALPSIMADFDQLQQVCTNLIINAIQAMPEGGKLILRTSIDDSQLKLEVKDTGYGISPENMRKLFTPFFTTKREVKGVGLGLAVAYGIIQRHKGRIDVQSNVGEGTTFAIYLPRYREEGKEKNQ